MVARAIWRDTPKGSRKMTQVHGRGPFMLQDTAKALLKLFHYAFVFLLDLALLVVNFIDKIPMIKIPQQYARCCIWLQVTIRHSHYSVLP